LYDCEALIVPKELKGKINSFAGWAISPVIYLEEIYKKANQRHLVEI
jgi:hypothetical protein